MIMTTDIYAKMIAVTDRKLCERPFSEQIERICAKGPKAVLLREKDLSEDDYLVLAKEVKEICDRADVPLILHGSPKACLELGVRRLHMPLSGLRSYIAEANSQCGCPPFEELGTSCHSVEQMWEAVSLGATYIFLGNIFETQCKPGLAGKGLVLLKEVCDLSPVPVYAIGGISPEKLPEILKTGAAGACMMSGFMRI